MLNSGASEDQATNCWIRFSAFGWALLIELPQLVKDKVVRRAANWDAATVARLGRDWYEERHPCEYGFTFSESALHWHWGPQTMDSQSTKSWVFFLPWNWRFRRSSFYFPNGEHFFTELERRPRNAWIAMHAVKDACPKVHFDFEDYDGERVIASTMIEEREWTFGEGVLRWLKWFVPNKVVRSLDLQFSVEIGREKGSWKGGTCGHGIEMLPGETPEAAFRRYCEMEHRSKNGAYQLLFIGPTSPENVMMLKVRK